jgi:hypothetical protein
VSGVPAASFAVRERVTVSSANSSDAGAVTSEVLAEMGPVTTKAADVAGSAPEAVAVS